MAKYKSFAILFFYFLLNLTVLIPDFFFFSYITLILFFFVSMFFLKKDNTENFVYNIYRDKKNFFHILKLNLLNAYLLFSITAFYFSLCLYEIISLIMILKIKKDILYENIPFLSFYEYLFWGKDFLSSLKIEKTDIFYYLYFLFKVIIFGLISSYIILSVTKNDFYQHKENKENKNAIFYFLLIFIILSLFIDLYNLFLNEVNSIQMHVYSFKQIMTLLFIYYASLTFHKILITKKDNLYNYVKISVIYFLLILIQIIMYKILIDLYFFDILILFILLIVRDYIIKSRTNKEFNYILFVIFLYEIIYFSFILNSSFSNYLINIKDSCYYVFKILIAVILLFYKELIENFIKKHFNISKYKTEELKDDFYSKDFNFVKKTIENKIGCTFGFFPVKIIQNNYSKKFEVSGSKSYFMEKENKDIEIEIFFKHIDGKVICDLGTINSDIDLINKIIISNIKTIRLYLKEIKDCLIRNKYHSEKNNVASIFIFITKQKQHTKIKFYFEKTQENKKVNKELMDIYYKFKKHSKELIF